MSGLESIGVRVERAAVSEGISSGVAAIATEIASLLDRLAADAEAGAIDLRSLPMTTADRLGLEQLLGPGEVRATIDADGVSTVRETGIAGVWWTEHRNRQGEVLAELIEICRVPEILVLAPDALAPGARLLRERIAASSL
ncbi:MAG: hydrogenase expression/formation C-terminal domain-containing protein [Gammaproteobacteria bacterium]